MHEYVSYIFQLVRQDGALAIAVVCLVLAAATVVYAVLRRQGRAFPWKRAVVLALLAGYLAALCSMTLTGREAFGAVTNFHLFRAWREAWNSFSVKNWLLVLLNVAAFVPLGLLLPLAFRPFRRWYLTVPVGFFTSLAIEALQLATGRGTFDVDDLFTNTLGCALGYCLVMVVLLLHARQTARRWLPYLACPAAFCLAIGGIFAVYALKPYGNLSCAPSYRADLSEVSWTLACDLTDDAGTAMVYRTESLTKESCEDFAAAFAQRAGITFPDAYYYDDMTYFANHSSGDTLSVDYRDSSYIYRLGEPPAVSEGSETELRGLLAQLGITVPEGAVFSQEDSEIYRFTADFLPVGGVVYGGELQCHVQDGFLERVENHLLTLTPQQEEPLLPQAEAYDRMTRGKFDGAVTFSSHQPLAVTVSACTITYQSDTKGFYQPVYRFTVMQGEEPFTEVRIPALQSP